MAKLRVDFFTRQGNFRKVGMACVRCGRHKYIVNDVDPDMVYGLRTKFEVKTLQDRKELTSEEKAFLLSEKIQIRDECYIKTKREIYKKHGIKTEERWNLIFQSLYEVFYIKMAKSLEEVKFIIEEERKKGNELLSIEEIEEILK